MMTYWTYIGIPFFWDVVLVYRTFFLNFCPVQSIICWLNHWLLLYMSRLKTQIQFNSYILLNIPVNLLSSDRFSLILKAMESVQSLIIVAKHLWSSFITRFFIIQILHLMMVKLSFLVRDLGWSANRTQNFNFCWQNDDKPLELITMNYHLNWENDDEPLHVFNHWKYYHWNQCGHVKNYDITNLNGIRIWMGYHL